MTDRQEMTGIQASHDSPPDVRDPTYYFDDGDVVLLVGETLFKVHSSVLGRESELFRGLATSRAEQDWLVVSDLLIAQEGPQHELVYRIPRVKADHFRHFLLMFYGRPSDQQYRSIIGDAVDVSQHTVPNFRIYLDVADLAGRFAAPSLESWARTQLKRVVKSPEGGISRYYLSSEYQLRALQYAKSSGDGDLVTNVRNLIQLHFAWVSNDSPIKVPTQSPQILGALRERAIQMYKVADLRQIDLPLFGYMFCYVLSLGHEIWMKDPLFTRADRVIFLSAQVQLTPLPVGTLGLDWVCTLTPDNQRGEETQIECCEQCNFYPAWEAALGSVFLQEMRENTTPLFGISQLVLLPFRRLQFSDLVQQVRSTDCQSSCATRIVDFVDKNIQNVHIKMTEYCRDVE
ncbi:hypothetical protein BDV93DRAFT_561738 [Ceratobasidium sp. AG-I]|nr:hypothetical protein BDV93DRAFT_561738 [Ceratobasidium sp. AG-I]